MGKIPLMILGDALGCRLPFPLGGGFAEPKLLTKSGALIIRRRREELCWICDRMVASSFFPGHQVPAARRLSPPGLTENVITMVNREPHHLEGTALTHSEEPNAWTQHILHKTEKGVKRAHMWSKGYDVN